MSFYSSLLETYDYCESLVGVEKGDNPVLLPPFFSTQMAHLEICINEQGNYVHGSTKVLTDKKEQMTIIPCFEKSINRTSTTNAPHPLFDKISYIAGDVGKYLDYSIDYYNKYIQQLRCIANSINFKSVDLVLSYLEKGKLISDLLSDSIVFLDADGKVAIKRGSDFSDVFGKDITERYPLYKLDDNPKDTFVRFRVMISGQDDDRLWLDKTLWAKFIQLRLHQPGLRKGFCYVTGKETTLATMAPAKIRSTGDKAKIISSNDSAGFTYRGRFLQDSDGFQIGMETCEKIFNVLKWLIARQGSTPIDEQVYVAWGINNEEIPKFDDDLAMLGLAPQFSDVKEVYTEQGFAEKLRKAFWGYSGRLEPKSNVRILGLDAATPGRLAIIYYRELTGQDFIGRLTSWFSTCSWKLSYFDAEKKYHVYYGSPTLYNIIKVALGDKAPDKEKKYYQKRLVPCIYDAATFPKDIMKLMVENARNPQKYEETKYKSVLETTCAVVRKFYNDLENGKGWNTADYKEVWKVGLGKVNMNRSYLFGRLLAYADEVEKYSMYVSGEKPRQTNAERYMTQYSLKPAKTWRVIYDKLIFYFQRLGEKKSYFFRKDINQIIASIGEGFNDLSLDDVFLLGYSAQANEFENIKQQNKEEKNDNE